MNVVCLTRRNLLTLLSKLDRVKDGGESECTIIKRDTTHPTHPCSDITIVQAVEDEIYYANREAGRVHPADEPKKP